MQKNFYQILELPQTAHLSEIKRSYKDKCLKFHPDKTQSTEAKEMFSQLQLAYHTLVDPHLRALYDDELKDAPRNEEGKPFLQIEGNELFKCFEYQSRFRPKGSLFVYQNLKKYEEIFKEKVRFKEGVPCSLQHCSNIKTPLLRIQDQALIPYPGAVLLYCTKHAYLHLCDEECTNDIEFCPLLALWFAQHWHRNKAALQLPLSIEMIRPSSSKPPIHHRHPRHHQIRPPPPPSSKSQINNSDDLPSSSSPSSSSLNNNNNNNGDDIKSKTENQSHKHDIENIPSSSSSSSSSSLQFRTDNESPSLLLSSSIRVKHENHPNDRKMKSNHDYHNSKLPIRSQTPHGTQSSSSSSSSSSTSSLPSEMCDIETCRPITVIKCKKSNKRSKYTEGIVKVEQQSRSNNNDDNKVKKGFLRLLKEREVWVCIQHAIPHICTIQQCDRLMPSAEGYFACWATGKEYEGLIDDNSENLLDVNLSSRKRILSYLNGDGQRVETVVDVPWGLDLGEAIPEIENSPAADLARRIFEVHNHPSSSSSSSSTKQKFKKPVQPTKKRKRTTNDDNDGGDDELYENVDVSGVYHQYVGILDAADDLEEAGDYTTTLHGRIGDLGDHEIAEEEREEEHEIVNESNLGFLEFASDKSHSLNNKLDFRRGELPALTMLKK